MLVKVCGLKEQENLKQIINLDIQMIGLNFFIPSKRYIGENRRDFTDLIPSHIHRVGVFVNEGFDKVIELGQEYDLDYVQLHHKESPEYCLNMQKHFHVIKAFGITEGDNIDMWTRPYQFCDILLFDTKTKLYGGSGQKFNWEILNSYTGETPFLLSGGIGPDDYESINNIDHPRLMGVDINSQFESEPGVKNLDKLSYFINNLNDHGGL